MFTDMNCLAYSDTSYGWRLFQYAYRGYLSTGRPAFYASWSNSRLEPQFRTLTDLGFPAFFMDDVLESARKEKIPETTELGSKEIDALPPYMKYFKCSGRLEKGECDNEKKYSTPCYDEREGKASWHPG
jgi:hypothetical protein